MQDQKTCDDAPTVFFLPPAPLASPSATRPTTKVTAQQRAARESVTLPYVPEVPQLDMKAMQERIRAWRHGRYKRQRGKHSRFLRARLWTTLF